jgi:hypothetical protein
MRGNKTDPWLPVISAAYGTEAELQALLAESPLDIGFIDVLGFNSHL